MMDSSTEASKDKEKKSRKPVACEACRKRRRKCEGQLPCTFCVSKGMECVPAVNTRKSLRTGTVVAFDGSLVKENILLGNVEIKTHIDFFFKIEQLACMLDYTHLTNPKTLEQEIQAYTVSALAAQLRGQHGASIKYATKARSLVGPIFDLPTKDSVIALILMSYYWRKTLVIPMCAHYANVAWSLMKLIDKPDSKSYLLCLNEFILSTDAMNGEQKSAMLVEYLHTEKGDLVKDIIDKTHALRMDVYAHLFALFGCFIVFPRNLSTIFLPLGEFRIKEEDRVVALPILQELENYTVLLGVHGGMHQLYALSVRVYHVLLEWKSEHIPEAMVQADLCLEMCNLIRGNDVIDLTTDFAHICMLATVIQFFYSQGCYDKAAGMCEYIRYVCIKMGPSYQFVLELISRFLARLPSTTTSTTSTVTTTTSVNTPTSSSPLNFTFTANNSVDNNNTNTGTTTTPLMPTYFEYYKMQRDRPLALSHALPPRPPPPSSLYHLSTKHATQPLQQNTTTQQNLQALHQNLQTIHNTLDTQNLPTLQNFQQNLQTLQPNTSEYNRLYKDLFGHDPS